MTSDNLIEEIGNTQPVDVPDLLARRVELVVAAYDHLRTGIQARSEQAIGPFSVASAWLDALALTDGALWDLAANGPRLTRFGAAILAQASFHQVGIEWPANDEARRLGDHLIERLVGRSARGDAEPRPDETPERGRFLGEVDLPVYRPLQVAALASAVAANARGASRLARGGMGYRLRRVGNKLLADATSAGSTPAARIAGLASAITCYESELDCYGQGLGFQATGRAALAHAQLTHYQVFAEMLDSGDPKDLDAAIQNYRHAVVDLREGWPDWRQAQLSCARALSLRYTLKESVPDLDAALVLYLQVERREPKRQLGEAGWDWLAALEQRTALPKSGRYHNLRVRIAKRLLAELPEGSVEWVEGHLRLGDAYAKRAGWRRSDSDLDRAIEEYTVALRVPAGAADGLARCWWKLAVALHERYRQRQSTDDYRRALEAYNSAISVFLADSPHRASCVADRDTLLELHAANESREAGANLDQ